MTSSTSRLFISVSEQNAYFKVIGSGNVHLSVMFKACLNRLHAKGVNRFCIILNECPMMDSTFLGILVGFCRQLDEKAADRGAHADKMILYSPTKRVLDSIENLGFGYLFKVTDETDQTFDFQEVPRENVDRKEFTRHSLEAHQNLMDLNPDNIPKFKDVTRFLEEELNSSQDSDQQF